jgi:hypothetical protein
MNRFKVIFENNFKDWDPESGSLGSKSNFTERIEEVRFIGPRDAIMSTWKASSNRFHTSAANLATPMATMMIQEIIDKLYDHIGAGDAFITYSDPAIIHISAKNTDGDPQLPDTRYAIINIFKEFKRSSEFAEILKDFKVEQ